MTTVPTPSLRRIVVGCDGTAEGSDAVVLGQLLAAATGAHLSLVTVIPPQLFPIEGMTDRKTLRRQAEHILEREHRRCTVETMTNAVTGSSVAQALHRHASRWGGDVVVIGSTPDAEPGHVRIGRRGRQLLQNAPFALAIAPRGLAAATASLDTIGVGYEGGRESTAALEAAAVIARGAGARLAVLGVIDDRVVSFVRSADVTALSATIAESREHRDALARAEQALETTGVPGEVRLSIGDPGLSLRQASADLDLIVVGSRRWGTVARLLAGSVGETLVADARCAVLLVPRPARRVTPTSARPDAASLAA